MSASGNPSADEDSFNNDEQVLAQLDVNDLGDLDADDIDMQFASEDANIPNGKGVLLSEGTPMSWEDELRAELDLENYEVLDETDLKSASGQSVGDGDDEDTGNLEERIRQELGLED